jgi:type II secretory pathway component GspD/PulD (secretin)
MSRIWILITVAMGLAATVAVAEEPGKTAPAAGAAPAVTEALDFVQRQQRTEAAPQAERLTVAKSGTPQHTRLVYHLKNCPANNIAKTVQELLQQEKELRRSEGAAGKDAPVRNVVIVPEIIGNILVISGAPDVVEEVRKLLDELDQPAALVLLEMEIGEAPAGEVKTAVESPGPDGKSAGAVPRSLRLLEKPPHMETIGRVRLTTMSNQPAFAQLGARVPNVTGVSSARTGNQETKTTGLANVGLILGVTPRISADGTITMAIDAEKSQVGPENEGIPISTAGNTVIPSPRIDMTTIQTTVQVPDGQTIILGSVARENKSGKELFIIVTPHIVRLDEAKKSR